MRFSFLTRLAPAMAALAVMTAGGSAFADPLNKDGMTVEDVNSWLRAKGCDTSVGEKGDYVACKVNNHVFAVFMSDCAAGRCRSLLYFYGISFQNGVKPDDASADAFINAWNVNYRWIRASVDDKRNVNLEMDYLLSPGGTTENLNAGLDIFLGGVNVFGQYLNGKTADGSK